MSNRILVLAARPNSDSLTMDSPTWFYRIFLGALGQKLMKKSVLEFCGLNPGRAGS